MPTYKNYIELLKPIVIKSVELRFVPTNDNRVRDYKARGQFSAIWRSLVCAQSINQMSSTNKYDENDTCLFVDYLGASAKNT